MKMKKIGPGGETQVSGAPINKPMLPTTVCNLSLTPLQRRRTPVVSTTSVYASFNWINIQSMYYIYVVVYQYIKRTFRK